MKANRQLRKTSKASSDFGHGTSNSRQMARYELLVDGTVVGHLTADKVGFMQRATWELRGVKAHQSRVHIGTFAGLKARALTGDIDWILGFEQQT